MRRFEISADGFPTQQLECSGCSGDALTLALADTAVQQWKVNRRSPDGRSWFFDVTLQNMPDGATTEFRVDTLS
jgi:hypothetical protein